MYKAVKKTRAIWIYIKSLVYHAGAPKLHWEDNTSCISVVKDRIVTPRFKHIDMPVCFLQEQFDNGLFIPKYDNYSVIPEDMCTKTFVGPVISQSTKCMTGFIFYPTSDT